MLCKGSRALCGLSNCPILEKYSLFENIHKFKFKKELYSKSPPGFFVGRYNYPQVNVGPLVTINMVEEIESIDEPDTWFGKSLNEIIALRTQLFKSSIKTNIKSSSDSVIEKSKLIAMASTPVLTELKLEKIISPQITFDSISAPWGISGKISKIDFGENPKIHPKIDYVASDYDLSATEAIKILYDSGFTVTSITRVLSAGVLGFKRNRRFVPTRWSITAVDQTASNILIDSIKKYTVIDKFMVFKSNYLGNDFRILFVPSVWSFEQVEGWMPGNLWVSGTAEPFIINDFEYYGGRKSYAKNVAGGYYAGRIAVAEYLEKIRRQAAVIILREVKPEYAIPVGVWQIRENVRHALKNPPTLFDDFNIAFKAATGGLSIPFEKWIKISELFSFFSRQKKLDVYL
ncbi:MAG: Nre family DNA repair protein [Candidatus Odinarchaeia archaeon]